MLYESFGKGEVCTSFYFLLFDGDFGRWNSFKYLGKTRTNQNSIHEEIGLTLGNALQSFGAESFVFQFTNQI